ncbi:MAG: UDP-glucose/GDP-mannose dehydrogenase family protein [Candidatus Omnitrophica bacterium]|nr:UDP-glucose/GDP-mannose dehydrogenase family protein [Candidatus Omnitrophota bacterium]MDD5429548.1 UDP-glucose/GDP-mannose dehydrogenase family protein [Candidatus Omnitrophota bacterium]
MKTARKYKICVVGAGHVGLVAAACFSKLGHKVVCVDNDRNKIQMLKEMSMPFHEPGLEALVKRGLKRENLNFLFSLTEGIRSSEVIFIAVGTPPKKDGSADLSSVENVAYTAAKNLNSYKLVVGKSTVPVQTGKRIQEIIENNKDNGLKFDVASNPEFLREGKAIYDFFYPDRIVLGVESKKAENILKGIYSLVKAPFVVTDINTAELIKHASNSFLATKISFINAVSRVCDLAGADIEKVSKAMGMDRRIGSAFLQAGIGYGGFCFPKDIEAFAYISKKLGYEFGLLREVRNINQGQVVYFLRKIKGKLGSLKNKRAAVLGLSFKPGTDDMRFAPAVKIVEALSQEGVNLSLYDPKSMGKSKKVLKGIKRVKFFKSPYAAVAGADCVCFLTEWDEFRKLDLRKIKKIMKHPFIADGRNMLDKKKVLAAGFEYFGIGR